MLCFYDNWSVCAFHGPDEIYMNKMAAIEKTLRIIDKFVWFLFYVSYVLQMVYIT